MYSVEFLTGVLQAVILGVVLFGESAHQGLMMMMLMFGPFIPPIVLFVVFVAHLVGAVKLQDSTALRHMRIWVFSFVAGPAVYAFYFLPDAVRMSALIAATAACLILPAVWLARMRNEGTD